MTSMAQHELPATVQSKIAALKDQEMQARTIVTSTQAAISETERAYGLNPHGDKAAAISREITRLRTAMPDHQAKHRAIADLNARVTHYLSQLPTHIEIDEAKPIKLKTRSDETHQQAVIRLRTEIMHLISERSKIERASPTVREMKAWARKYVQSLGEHTPPRLVVEHAQYDPSGRLIRDKKFGLIFGRGVIGESEPGPLELLAWVNPNHLRDKLEEMVDGMHSALAGRQMDASERKQRLDEIRQELLRLERREVAHIEQAIFDGVVISHRPSVDIYALLGIAIASEAKANAA